MSRNIFTSALLVALLVVLVAGNAQAQTNVSTSLNGSATVMTALTIAQSTALAFGNIPASRTAVLDPKNVANSYVGSTHTVGLVTISGANATPVLVTYPATMTLSDGVDADLTLTLAVKGHKLLASQGSSVDVASGSAVTTAAGGDATPGAFYLWVGGSLPSGANAGAYTGTANFSVEYQ